MDSQDDREFAPVKFGPLDMELLAVRDYEARKLASAFGVPARYFESSSSFAGVLRWEAHEEKLRKWLDAMLGR